MEEVQADVDKHSDYLIQTQGGQTVEQIQTERRLTFGLIRAQKGIV